MSPGQSMFEITERAQRNQQVKLATFKNNNHLSDNGYSHLEEEQIFDKNLQDIIDHPRFYLDNLEGMKTYRVSWHDYNKMKNITLPYRYCKKRNSL